MTTSILNDVKKVLGIEPDYDVYDVDVLMHINSAFSTLSQLGVGPQQGFGVDDATAVWTDFLETEHPEYRALKSYVYLRVKRLFDPPQTGYLDTAIKEQIQELEWRLNVTREGEKWLDPSPVIDDVLE